MARVVDATYRRELAERALLVLQREGLDLPNATLASRLELKRPTLLYYFPNKASIFEAAFDALFSEQVAYVVQRISEADHPLDKLDAQIRAVHSFHEGREGRVVFLTQAIASLGVEKANRFVELGNQAFEAHRQQLKVELREAILDGRMHDCDVDALIRLVRSTVDGLMVQRFMTGCDLAPIHAFFKTTVLDPLRREPEHPKETP